MHCSHVAALLAPKTPKALLLAAIEAAPSIRPDEASVLLVDLTDSDDEEIVEAAQEALAMAEALSAEGEDPFEDDDE